MSGDKAWSFVSWIAGFAVFVVATVVMQAIALSVLESWWGSSDAAGQPIPNDTVEFTKWVIGGGVGLLFGKLAGDAV